MKGMLTVFTTRLEWKSFTMELLTKRQRELLTNLCIREAIRLDSLIDVVELGQHKRVLREKKHEFTDLIVWLQREDRVITLDNQLNDMLK
jgi:hypothetical protein